MYIIYLQYMYIIYLLIIEVNQIDLSSNFSIIDFRFNFIYDVLQDYTLKC